VTRATSLLSAAVLALLLGGIAAWLLLRRPPTFPSGLRLLPLHYHDLPGWKQIDPRAALAALRRSCRVLAQKPPSAPMAGAGYAGTMAPWQRACAGLPQGPQSPRGARQWFEHHFLPAEIAAGAHRRGLLTGYYEPEITGRRRREGSFRIPVYGRPSDLISVDLGRFRPRWQGRYLFGRLDGEALVPYPSREVIASKGLATAPVLFWTSDPEALFFLQVQGSGRVRFGNGSVFRVDYAGQNGRPYTAIGRILVHMGALSPSGVSLERIRAWLHHHPQLAPTIMDRDASYVFFRLAPLSHPGLGPVGTEGVPLTPRASLAVDPRFHPLGIPFYVVAPPPHLGVAPLRQLMIAQDTGGAIKGALRGDVFWGFGASAEELAGAMKAQGKFFVLLPASLWRQLARQRSEAND
jgi:membrane-bound lytic murein transglycosylase A